MSDIVYKDRSPSEQIEYYKTVGEDLLYGLNTISNMSDDQIKQELDLMDDGFGFILMIPEWIYIFEDVLKKRRINKINKIKKNILYNGIN